MTKFVCKGCDKEVVPGQLRRGDDWHADCFQSLEERMNRGLAMLGVSPISDRVRKKSRRDNDIKAPDGYLLGGIRMVRKDGTVLFQRGWWQCPMDWAGEEIWVHNWMSLNGREEAVEAWPPGVRIWAEKAKTEILERTDRPDAALGWRNPSKIAWSARERTR